MKHIWTVALTMATAACSGARPDIVGIRPVNEQPSGGLQDAMARGDLLFSRGDYALALDAYRRAVRSDPRDARALNGVAISYAAMGRHDLARQFFELALARAPQDGRIYRNFARSLKAQGRGREAEALLAQFDPAAVHPGMARPTLAQIAAAGSGKMAAASTGQTELERLSPGEVQLRTSPAGNASLGKRMPQLTTAIMTVADGNKPVQASPHETGPDGSGPVALVKTLNTPIVQVDATPLAGEDTADGLFQRLWQQWRGDDRG